MTQPVPENFKRLLLAELSSRIPETPAALPERRHRVRWRGHPVLAGAGAAAAAATVAISLLVTGSTPAAAWTVTKERDGTIAVTIRQLNDPNGLLGELRRDGVSANFDGPPYTTPQQTIDLACLLPMTRALHRALSVRTSTDPHAAALLIRPSAIPPGDTLNIYWADYSPNGFGHSTVGAGGGLRDAHGVQHEYAIPLTVSGDFAFDAKFVNSAGRCVQ